jgi:glyoxylase-like metal-dependent hydrolase (beta-lactamase superfamily II)
MKSLLRYFTLIFCLFLALVISNPQDETPITIERVAGRVSCLFGQGGNIGILEGDLRLLVVDSQYAQNAPQVMAAIQKLSPKPIRILVNTHYHGDHTGGNPSLGKGASIISHENCKASFLKGLKAGQSPEDMGAPQQTYDTTMTVQVGEETVELLHFGSAHTAGDTVVVFKQSQVIHAGDLFFHGIPPYIDVGDGADTANWTRTIEKLARDYPDYRVIPGHGPVTDMKAWQDFAAYLKYLREQVTAAIQAGKNKAEAQRSIDLSRFQHIPDQGEFLTKQNNIGWIYDEMTKN